ncbi:DDE-type integrase/transposase/recombinase (plasmid) [Qingshengfaniella alkalisoli]|uniref:DDE-type integrase/transposase/recombinase n=1 Tax=Qingshengfaniella alkalisoli TaxID=2599296 RepID=A0A5B8J7K3_9RHOB|nr:DDE-type integrase/transposase/recombinase [Qingshengfaniella alkalisoli]
MYRAVDKHGDTVDFMLSERHDTAAVRRFCNRRIETNGAPGKVLIDKSGANMAGFPAPNVVDMDQLTRKIEYAHAALAKDWTNGIDNTEHWYFEPERHFGMDVNGLTFDLRSNDDTRTETRIIVEIAAAFY